MCFFDDLDNYGTRVVQTLNSDGEINAVLLLSRNLTNEFLHDYSDYFELYTSKDGREGIVLRDGKTADDLRDQFRSYLTFDVLSAFMKKSNVAALGG